VADVAIATVSGIIVELTINPNANGDVVNDSLEKTRLSLSKDLTASCLQDFSGLGPIAVELAKNWW